MAGEFSTVTNVRVRLDVKEVDDSGFDTVTDANAGKVVTFNKSFADIRSIGVTAASNGNYPVSAYYDFQDIPNPESFIAFIIALQTVPALGVVVGQKVTGNFAWQVEGIERVTG